MSHNIRSRRSQGSIDYAYRVAEQAHRGQVRKYTGEPYITHPVEVAELVASVTEDCFMIEAALFHDVIEDTEETYWSLLEKGFYFITVRYVQELSEFSIPSDGNRKVRKALDRRYLARATSQAKTIKLADLICNSKSIIEHGEGFAVVFMKEFEELLEVLVEGDTTLYDQALEIIKNYKEEKK